MEILNFGGWVFYLTPQHKTLEEHKCGKWMYFFYDRDFLETICKKAIEENIVYECKHTDNVEGVACFYLNGDDIEGHKRVIQFFLDNDLIRKTKTGKLYNIGFKYDEQTLAGEYGKDFNAEKKLEHFIDLNTGKWRV